MTSAFQSDAFQSDAFQSDATEDQNRLIGSASITFDATGSLAGWYPGELPFSGRLGLAWPGKILLGHYGDEVPLAPDATLRMDGAASIRFTGTGEMRVVEAVPMSGQADIVFEGGGLVRADVIPSQHPNGSPGTNKTPTFRYDGIDITADVEIKLCEFTASSRGNPGTATVRVRNPSIPFVTGKELTCDVGGKRLWGGFVTTVRHGYYFPAAVEQNHFVVLQGVDYNVLQQKRVIYDKVTPTKTKLTAFPPDTPDADVIRYYAKNHTDLPDDDINLLVGIEHVGTPSQDDEISGAAGWSFGELLQQLRFHTGAIDYIDPEKRFIHTDVDTPNAPFGISDKPEAGEVGCRELEIDFGAEAMRNDALMWGAGQGFTQPVFARETDDPSVDEHGLWQVGKMIPTIWRQATIDRIAESYVYGSPQNKRGGKDDRVAVRCAIFEPGLRVADKVNVRSEVWGFEDVLPVREMRITFPTPTDPRFDLVLSHEIDDPWSTFEYFFPQIDVDDPEIPEVEIKLPPTPQWVDGEGDTIIIGHTPPECVDGRFTYIIDDEEDVFPTIVQMRYFRDTVPLGMAAIPGHPSGVHGYMVDGNSETGVLGYRWGAGDSVQWESDIPLLVSGFRIVQGIGAPIYTDDPGKNYAGQIAVYASYNKDGSSPFLVHTTALHRGRGVGPTILEGEFGPLLGVKWVRAQNIAPYWIQIGWGDMPKGWIVNEASLFATCIATTPETPTGMIIGGSSGYWSPAIIDETDTPDGEDDSYTYYRILTPWLPGTLMVWVDGLLLAPSEYEENPVEQWIRFSAPIAGEIYIRYLPL